MYLIWSSADQMGEESVFPNDTGEDRLLLDDTGFLKRFFNVEAAKDFASAAGIHIEEERPILHDLNRVERFTTNTDEHAVAAGDCLSAWNLYVDLATSVSPRDTAFLAVVDENFDVYNKLCQGAGILPQNESSSISWGSDEVARLRRVLSLGQGALSNRLAASDS